MRIRPGRILPICSFSELLIHLLRRERERALLLLRREAERLGGLWLDFFVSPAWARCLLTMREATSSSRPL
jgi:hypothetical protein